MNLFTHFDPLMQHNEDDLLSGLNEEDSMKYGCLQSVIFLIAVIIAMVVCSLCSSCTTTKYVPIVEYQIDTVRINRTAHDSIYLHDSTYVFDKGDTLYVERWHIKYKLKEIHDTMYISKIDSVPVIVPAANADGSGRLSWWQKIRIKIGDILLWCWGIITVFFFIRWLIKTSKP